MSHRVAIVGSRDYPYLGLVREFVNSLPLHVEVVSGGARGVDRTAEFAARARGLSVRSIPADWNTHGRAAGFLRNTEIVAAADEVVAFWDGRSRGTFDTINKARAAGKPVRIIPATPDTEGRE